MNKALVLVMCDVLVLSAMSLSSGVFSSSKSPKGEENTRTFTAGELRDAMGKWRRLHAEFVDATNKVTLLSNVLVNVSEDWKGLTKTTNTLGKTLGYLSVTNDYLISTNIALTATNVRLNAHLTNALERISSLSNINYHLSITNDHLISTNIALTASNVWLNAQLINAIGKISILTDMINKQSNELVRVTGEVRDLKGVIDGLRGWKRRRENEEKMIRELIDQKDHSRAKIIKIEKRRFRRDPKQTEFFGLVVEIDANLFVLTHEESIEFEKGDSLQIKVNGKTCDVDKMYNVNVKEMEGLLLLSFNHPEKVCSFPLGTENWRIETESSFYRFHLKNGAYIPKESNWQVPDGVEIKKDEILDSAGDVLISQKTGRVAFWNKTMKRVALRDPFLPIPKLTMSMLKEVRVE